MNRFLDGYIEAALWSSTTGDDRPMDSVYSRDDISSETISKMEIDCKKFYEENKTLLADSGQSDNYSGHDFWLTRNNHGCGFWDRDLGEIGEKLTEACHKFGEFYLYDEAGKIYHM